MSRSILQDEKKCFISGDEGVALHRHHIMNGPNRRLAEEDGLWVYLRADLHGADSPHATPHNNAEVDLWLKQKAQEKFEETHTREEWMERYGRNYL